jgi:FAD:protein FMN transferase
MPSATATATRLPLRHVEHCMGTAFSFDIRFPGVDRNDFDRVLEWLHWADETFSTYRADSEISRLGRHELTLDECSSDVAQILERSTELEAATRGYFSAWAGGSLDPSGLVKGWAIQRASEMLIDAGSLNHCINGGGDVQCIGGPDPGTAWRIGIAHPLRPDTLVGVAQGHHLAVATSGSSERGAHVINPHTRTSPEAIASATLIGLDLATTDAYATAAFAMGAAAPEWIGTLEGYHGLIVFADGTEWSSSGPAVSH